MLLLMRRRSQKALRLRVATFIKSERLFEAIRSSVVEGRELAIEASLQRTREQLTSIGYQQRVTVGRSFIGDSEIAARAEAHAVTSRWLESQVPDGRQFLPNLERRAAWEADQAFNQARREAIDRLPHRVKANLWLRWDTAGDRRVCPRCDRMDGQFARATEGFNPGAPLHGGCRCTETILAADEI